MGAITTIVKTLVLGLVSVAFVPVSQAGDAKHEPVSGASEAKGTEPLSMSSTGYALVKVFEGFKGRAYPCPAKKLTIGYGHLCASNLCKVDCSKGLSKAEAQSVLECDTRRYEAYVRRVFGNSLSQNEFDALVSFSINFGQRFQNSDHPNLKNAVRDFINAKTADERRLAKIALAKRLTEWIGDDFKGLKIRRGAEAHLFLNGTLLDDKEAMEFYRTLSS